MKKINNKGFMLAEVVIVSAVMVTTLVGLYTGFSNTYKAYEVKMNYYDVDVIYALKNLENILIDNMLLNNYISNINASGYYKIEQGSDSNSLIYKFYETYDINSIYLVENISDKIWNDTATDDSLADNVDEEFQDYLELYNDSYNADYKYVLIAVTNDGTYGALRIK